LRSSTLIAHLAGEHRRTNPDPDRIAELREQIREAQLTEWVERQLTAAPPLSRATRDRLAALLTSSHEIASTNRGEAADVVAA
jgi:hypothetical protein